ncbi:MAG: lactate utilization protein [Clostridia bacterium]|jgi:hypothetical protein|nr:lactate utilization protein [Clostridia bacterium]
MDKGELSMLDLRKIRFPLLKAEAHDRATIQKEHFRQRGEVAVNNLIKNNFKAYYCPTLEEAKTQVLSLIPKESTIGFGDSHTIFALALEEELEKMGCISIPHTCAVNANAFREKIPGFQILANQQETKEILMQYLVADVFMLGANAITMDGQIINIDGAGNRIAGSIYGSERMIFIAGANKLVRDVEAGLTRTRDEAAQMNNIKYDHELSCNKTGLCQECTSQYRNCNITAIYHKQPEAGDFHVIIIGEELGF